MGMIHVMVLVAAGLGVLFALSGFVHYAGFVSRLAHLSPAALPSVSLEPGECHPPQNRAVAVYFWRRRYRGNDAALNRLGDRVRRDGLLGLGSLVVAIILAVIEGLV